MHKNSNDVRRLRKVIGTNIHQQRREKNMTLRKLGRLCMLTPDTLDQYELGKNAIRLEELGRIAAGLEVELKELLLPGF